MDMEMSGITFIKLPAHKIQAPLWRTRCQRWQECALGWPRVCPVCGCSSQNSSLGAGVTQMFSKTLVSYHITILHHNS